MRTIIQNAFIMLLVVCLLAAVQAWGQTGGDYELSQSTIAGGGGTCSGGDFTLTGTIGQPAAGVMTGGDFMLVGGYGVIINTAPVACIVDGNQTVECEGYWGATATLDGSCSTDSDSAPGTNDDIVYFDWYEQLDPCGLNFEDYLGSGEIIDCNLPLGEHIIILEVIDKAWEFDTNEVTIIVQDTTPPVITCPPDVNLECPADTTPNVTGEAMATDTCGDVTITYSDLCVLGCSDTKTCSRRWTATDESGNSSSCVQTIVVVDTTPPVPSCPEDIVVSGFGAVDVNFNPTATDDCDPNPGVTTDVPSGSPFETGITTVTATATDACGNLSTCTFDVLVSCFAVNHLKIGTKADRKGDNVDIKGTFDPAVPPDLAVDDVMYSIKDGQGHTFTFSIPAGSFKVDGKPDKQKFKFDSPKGSEPDIKAKFDFLKCKFELKVKKVSNTGEISGTTLTVELQAGVNLGQDVVEIEVEPKHLEHKKEPKLDCCPK